MTQPCDSTNSALSTKACKACRALKVRCIIDTAPGQRRCQRCTKSDRDCVFPIPQKRKQRKRTDARVAELEDELRSMKGALERDNAGQRRPSPGFPDHASPSSSGEVIPSPTIQGSLHHGSSPNTFGKKAQSMSDPFDPEIICDATAKDLYEIYNNDLVEHFPGIIFPGDYSVERLRAEKPTLFLAIMAAAARKSKPELSIELGKCVLQSYATRVFMKSEKSLELVQSMIVIAVWYSPPDDLSQGQHKYYEYIHMAATMAMDLGLGTKPSQSEGFKPQYTQVEFPACIDTSEVASRAELDSTTLESRRTFLSCYIICCG